MTLPSARRISDLGHHGELPWHRKRRFIFMRPMFCWIIIGVVLSATGIAAAQAPAAQAQAAQAPQPSSAGVDSVMAYAGTWKVHGEHFATAYSQVGKEDKTLRND